MSLHCKKSCGGSTWYWINWITFFALFHLAGCAGKTTDRSGTVIESQSALTQSLNGGSGAASAIGTGTDIATVESGADANAVVGAKSNTENATVAASQSGNGSATGTASDNGSDAGGTKVVWVMMKDQADLSQAVSVTDWSIRGQSVVDSLTNIAENSQNAIRATLAQQGINYQPFWIVNALRVEANQATIDALAKRSDVSAILADDVYSIPEPQPGDELPKVLNAEWNLNSMGAPKAWNTYGFRGEDIVIANIDTGVQYNHPALVRQYRGRQADGTFNHNYNWYDPGLICGNPSVTPCDNVNHGTHTMGTMVGDDGDPGQNQIGVAPHAKWIAAKGCENNSCTRQSLLSAAQWILAPTDLNGQNPRSDLRPNVVNNSWGGGRGDTFFQAVVQAWVSAGIFPAFSAGNSGSSCGSANSPGDYPESYASGAFDINNALASWSSRGPSYFNIIKPNIAAPGVNVRSSIPNNGYGSYSGTSMASPHLAGTVALIWSAAPSLMGDIAATRKILDQSAANTSDLTCGGTAENNNMWGEGKLDAVAALDLSPRGPSGILKGVVTAAAGGAAVAQATVLIQGGTRDRTVTTDASGAYNSRLSVGTYTLTTKAFGYVTQKAEGVVITENVTTVQNFALVEAPSFTLSGVVQDAQGKPVAGAQVTVVGTPITPVTADQNGNYSFPKVPAGDYQVRAEGGRCFDPQTKSVTVSANTVLNFSMVARVDSFGYSCGLASYSFIDANTILPISNYGSANVTLPFPFTFYGQTYETVTVRAGGYIHFVPNPYGTQNNSAIPSSAYPNGAVYPFWDYLYVKPGTGTVRTQLLGSTPNQQFVIEWRNVSSGEYGGNATVRFEVILYENGKVLTQYATSGQPWQQGGSATIGVEDEAGNVAFQYSYNQPSVQAGTAILFGLPPSGLVEGTVVDANDGLPIARARVQAILDNKAVRTTYTTSKGFYRFQLPKGTYTVSATSTNYSVETAAVSVEIDQRVSQNFSLKTGLAVVTPTSIQIITTRNQTRSRTLTLQNTGTLGFNYSIDESGGGQVSVASNSTMVLDPSADLSATNTMNLFEGGIEPTGWSASASGDVIQSYTPQGMTAVWGLGYNTANLWISDGWGRANYEFTPEGTPTTRSWAAAWAGDWPADMAYDSKRNLLCQVNVGGDNGIYCWKPDTGEAVESITGSFAWTEFSQRGLAYRADDDSFYVGGWNQGVIYHIKGLSATDKGTVIGSCKPIDTMIAGLAYNNSRAVLWMSTNSYSDAIYELNPDDCSVLSTLAHPSPGYNGAGLDVDDKGNLWTMGQNPTTVYLMESGVPAYNDVSWLTEEPTSGSVDIGKSAAIKLTVNTANLNVGVYMASLYISSNTAKTSYIRVPITLIVSAYQQGVNAGGKDYTDTSGDPWAKDTEYTAGNWGYTQKSMTVSTKKKIAATADPTLYQSQRIDPYAYRFDNIPNGMYQIEMKFAELQNLKAGDRLVDLIVEETEVYPGHDIRYDVATYTADDHSFFIKVTDNHIGVRFVQTAGLMNPVINALRITQRPDK
jgi:subtilisin family serine protease